MYDILFMRLNVYFYALNEISGVEYCLCFGVIVCLFVSPNLRTSPPKARR